VLQALGVPLLGRTFDPLDFVMFGVGVLLAAFVDRLLFGRFLPGRREFLDIKHELDYDHSYPCHAEYSRRS
jgi:hypothetical protein